MTGGAAGRLARRPLVYAAVALMVLAAAASPRGQVAMPDPSAIAGTPLPAPELPDSSVTIRVVRERMGNNVAGQAVTLQVGGAVRTATTDEQGRAQFDNIPAGTLVKATATVDGETLTSQEFPVPARGGVRIALIAGIERAAAAEKAVADAAAREPARPGVVEFGPESRIIFEFQDDNLTVFYLLEVINNARTPIDIGGPLLMELPTGASGVSVMQGSSPSVSVRGDILTITGPFPPGKTLAQVGFALPQAGAATSVRQVWPAALAQIFVAAEKIGPMQLSSPQLTGTREMTSEGQVFIMGTGGRLNAGETLVVDLSGMPAQSTLPRDVALGTVVVIFAVGLWLAFSPAAARASEEARLQSRRDRLMFEVVALERKRQRDGTTLTPAEERRLQRATSELERVLAAMDQGPPSGDEGVAA
jgi:hypothetical protein